MIFDEIGQLLTGLGLNVCAAVDVPSRPEIRVDASKDIIGGPVGNILSSITPDGRIWRHQAQALMHLCAGHNMVISTGTASGKSLIFQLYALHKLRTEPGSKVLAFYPLRALANDQFNGWVRMANMAGIYDGVGRIDGDVRARQQAI